MDDIACKCREPFRNENTLIFFTIEYIRNINRLAQLNSQGCVLCYTVMSVIILDKYEYNFSCQF